MTERDPKEVMWAEALALIERAERLKRHFFQPGRGRRQAPCWEPPVDMYEAEGLLHILVALPGVEPENVEAAIERGVLIVAGYRPLPTGRRRVELHRMEIPHGYFERRIGLPPGQYELGEREVANGCLGLTLRRLR